MANLLADPTKWRDGDGYSGTPPPAGWNGTAYEFIGDYSGGAMITSYPAAAGDTVAFTIEVTTAATYDGGNDIFTAQVNRGGTFLTPFYGDRLLVVGSSVADSGPLQAGDIVTINYNQQYVGSYNADMVLTPAPDPTPAPAPAPPTPPEWCMELGRATRCYVSGFQRDRIHEASLVRGESRCLIADFNGALPKGQLIVKATWRCWNGIVGVMSNARIKDDQRETAIDLLAALPGGGMVKCEVTNDHGDACTQLFRILVRGGYWFEGEQGPAQGPSTLTVEIPVVVP